MFIVPPPAPNYPFSMSCSLYQAKRSNPALPEDLTPCMARGFRRYENPPRRAELPPRRTSLIVFASPAPTMTKRVLANCLQNVLASKAEPEVSESP